jgi:sugar lactone lactonase YvrE
MSTTLIQAACPVPALLGESPLWHPAEQAVYWIDIPGKAIHRLHPTSQQHQQWDLPTEPGTIALHEDGGIVIALRTGLVHFKTTTGALTPIVHAPYDPSIMRFNDGRCDARGRLWTGTIYEPRDKPNASLFSIAQGTLRDAEHPVTTSNGVAFSIDDKTLYHADTPAHVIRAYDFDLGSGRTSHGRVFAQFNADKTSPDYAGRPDGAAVDSDNTYWCAMFEGGRICRFSAEGALLEEIRVPAMCPTMVAFGGEDLRTMYITTARNNRSEEELARFPLSGCLLTLNVTTPGRLEYPYRA